MKFILLSDGHTDADGIRHLRGATLEHEKDLSVLFPGKFQIAAEDLSATDAVADSKEQELSSGEEPDDAVSDESLTEDSEKEIDLTAEYELALAHALVVIQKKSAFFVKKDGNVINDKSLKSRLAVRRFLETFIAKE